MQDGEPRLALAAEFGALSPAVRGLGRTAQSWDMGGGLVLTGWSGVHHIYGIERADGRVLGWVQDGADGLTNAWAVFVDGRAVIDAEDGQPLLSPRPQDGVSLLRLALQQRVL